MGQVTVFPAYLAAFFTYSCLLEGSSLNEAIRHARAAFPSTYQAGWVFWPAANLINFVFVGAAQRVVYVNVVGLAWNAFMSWQVSSKPAQAGKL